MATEPHEPPAAAPPPAPEPDSSLAIALGAAAETPPPPEDTEGPKPPRYEIEAKVGEGGMGTVYKARDRRLSRPVALKRIRVRPGKDEQEALARFLAEARAIASLNHYNIVQVYDVDQDDEGYFIVMEYLEGDTLKQVLKRHGPIGLERVIDLGQQLCKALEVAHTHGVVHRDIKPANILIDRQNVPKLLDFGLVQADEDSDPTVTGVMVGTPDYASPEQLGDAKHVDVRTDIYSLAATLYEALTGDSPRFLREAELPAALRPVLLKALHKDRAQRYQSAQQFYDALNEVDLTAPPAVAATPLCPKCGRANEPEAKFCTACGAAMPRRFVKCPRCEQENRIDVVFCAECGFEVRQHQRVKQLLERGEALLAAGDEEGALRQYVAILKLDPQQPVAKAIVERVRARLKRLDDRRHQATTLAGDGDFRGAIAAWQQLQKIAPRDREAAAQIPRLEEQARARQLAELLEQAQAALRTARFSDVEVACCRTLELDHDNPAARRLLEALPLARRSRAAELAREGLAAYNDQRYREARRLLGQAQELGGAGKAEALAEAIDLASVMMIGDQLLRFVQAGALTEATRRLAKLRDVLTRPKARAAIGYQYRRIAAEIAALASAAADADNWEQALSLPELAATEVAGAAAQEVLAAARTAVVGRFCATVERTLAEHGPQAALDLLGEHFPIADLFSEPPPEIVLELQRRLRAQLEEAETTMVGESRRRRGRAVLGALVGAVVLAGLATLAWRAGWLRLG